MTLRPDVVPKTSENFRALCKSHRMLLDFLESCCMYAGTKPKGEGFKGSKFHRVIPNFMCQVTPILTRIVSTKVNDRTCREETSLLGTEQAVRRAPAAGSELMRFVCNRKVDLRREIR